MTEEPVPSIMVSASEVLPACPWLKTFGVRVELEVRELQGVTRTIFHLLQLIVDQELLEASQMTQITLRPLQYQHPCQVLHSDSECILSQASQIFSRGFWERSCWLDRLDFHCSLERLEVPVRTTQQFKRNHVRAVTVTSKKRLAVKSIVESAGDGKASSLLNGRWSTLMNFIHEVAQNRKSIRQMISHGSNKPRAKLHPNQQKHCWKPSWY